MADQEYRGRVAVDGLSSSRARDVLASSGRRGGNSTPCDVLGWCARPRCASSCSGRPRPESTAPSALRRDRRLRPSTTTSRAREFLLLARSSGGRRAAPRRRCSRSSACAPRARPVRQYSPHAAAARHPRRCSPPRVRMLAGRPTGSTRRASLGARAHPPSARRARPDVLLSSTCSTRSSKSVPRRDHRPRALLYQGAVEPGRRGQYGPAGGTGPEAAPSSPPSRGSRSPHGDGSLHLKSRRPVARANAARRAPLPRQRARPHARRSKSLHPADQARAGTAVTPSRVTLARDTTRHFQGAGTPYTALASRSPTIFLLDVHFTSARAEAMLPRWQGSSSRGRSRLELGAGSSACSRGVFDVEEVISWRRPAPRPPRHA